jgi:hypothetical protein
MLMIQGNIELIGHPLFQLNLMLFLSLDIDDESQIYPILYKAGYSGLRIERNFHVPIGIRRVIREQIGRCNEIVAPDVFLEHVPSSTLVPVECKRSSGAMHGDQTLGLLALNGAELGSLIGKPTSQTWTAIVTYLTTEGHGAHVLAELERLSQRLRDDAQLVPAEACSLELSYRADGVYLMSVPRSVPLPDIDLNTPVQVLSISPDFDLRPLYLIPYVSSGLSDGEPFAEKEFQEQLKLAIIARLRDIGTEEYEFSLNDLIKEAVPVWDLWDNLENKRHIRNYVRDTLAKFFRELWTATHVQCRVRAGRIHVPSVANNRIRGIRRYLTSAVIRQLELGVIQTQFDTLNLD